MPTVRFPDSSPARRSRAVDFSLAAKSHGFTLIEILVVAAIVAVLAVTLTLAIAGNGERRLEGTAEQFRALVDAQQHFASMPLRIDPQAGLTAAQIAARARMHQRKHGLRLLVIDYESLVVVANFGAEDAACAIVGARVVLSSGSAAVDDVGVRLSATSVAILARETSSG